MVVASIPLLIRVGDTFAKVFRYGAGPIVYKNITAITKAAPAVVTATAHGLVNGWPVALTNVLGMTQINASAVPPIAPKAKDYHRITLIDANSFSLNDVNAAGYTAYKSGGVVQYATPVDLTGVTASMLVYPNGDKTATPVAFTSAAGDIVLDNTAKTITLTLSVAKIALLVAAMKKATYDFNLTSGAVVTSLAGGTITFDAGTSAPTT